MQIINSLVPIFSIIGLGMLLRWNGFLGAESTQAFNRFAYFLGLPLFLFYKLASAEAVSGSANLVLVTLISAVVLTFSVSWITSAVFSRKNASRGSAIQAGFRGNLAFMGLPLVWFLIEDVSGQQRDAIESAVLLALTPVILFFNVASVVALATYNENSEKEFSWKTTFAGIAKNPLIWACFGGALFQLSGASIPTAVIRTCSVIGGSAFPLALLGIGSQLVSISGTKGWTATIVPAINKCVICPLIGWGIGMAVGLSGVSLQVALILCAMPTAVSSYVLAEQMDGDADLAAGAVVVSTAVSFPTLAVLIWLTGGV